MPQIDDFLAGCPDKDGRLWLFSIGSTGALVSLPDSETDRRAFVDWIRKTVPFSADHRHPGNAFAHLRSTILKSGLTIPVAGGRPVGLKANLLENTAGRKSRPITMTLFSKGDDVSLAREEFTVEGSGWIDMIEISGRVMEIVGRSGIADGQVFVGALDERAAVVTIEDEMRLVLDAADFIDGLTRKAHGFDRKTAGAVAAALLGPTVAVPLVKGRLELGTWQQLMVMDLSGGGTKRIMVDVIGGGSEG